MRENNMDEQLYTPWKYFPTLQLHGKDKYEIVSVDDEILAWCDIAEEAFPRYIVAAVNDCTAAGLSVEDLENGAVERLVEAHAELGESAWEAHAFLGGYIDQMGPEAADIWQRLGIALAALENEPTQ
jgi:hypothetical protein